MEAGNEWHLGRTSERFESGGRGPGTISSGKGDAGGISYGRYQLSSVSGTVDEYLNWSSYGKAFEGLELNSDEFKARWRSLAVSDQAFGNDQHEFIKSHHYDVQLAVMAKKGLDLSERGPAVLDAIWSTAVQYRGLTPRVFQKALVGEFGEGFDIAAITDQQIVEAVQEYKHRMVEQHFSRSPQQWDALRQRTLDEKAALSEFARTGVFHEPQSHPIPKAEGLAIGQAGQKVRDLQAALHTLGYFSDDGHVVQVDGHFGKRTKEALMSFQRVCGLSDDGIAGPTTLEALEKRSSALSRLDRVAHPDHALYLQTRRRVAELDASLGRQPDQHTDNIASALVVQARTEGLSRIDKVWLMPDGTKMWGEQFSPRGEEYTWESKRMHVMTNEANTPMEQSGARWPEAMRMFEQQEQQEANLEQQRLQERMIETSIGGPSMSR